MTGQIRGERVGMEEVRVSFGLVDTYYRAIFIFNRRSNQPK